MRLAIVGSRSLFIDGLEKYIPVGVTEIVSGGAKGIDMCAKQSIWANSITQNIL